MIVPPNSDPYLGEKSLIIPIAVKVMLLELSVPYLVEITETSYYPGSKPLYLTMNVYSVLLTLTTLNYLSSFWPVLPMILTVISSAVKMGF